MGGRNHRATRPVLTGPSGAVKGSSKQPGTTSSATGIDVQRLSTNTQMADFRTRSRKVTEDGSRKERHQKGYVALWCLTDVLLKIVTGATKTSKEVYEELQVATTKYEEAGSAAKAALAEVALAEQALNIAQIAADSNPSEVASLQVEQAESAVTAKKDISKEASRKAAQLKGQRTRLSTKFATMQKAENAAKKRKKGTVTEVVDEDKDSDLTDIEGSSIVIFSCVNAIMTASDPFADLDDAETDTLFNRKVDLAIKATKITETPRQPSDNQTSTNAHRVTASNPKQVATEPQVTQSSRAGTEALDPVSGPEPTPAITPPTADPGHLHASQDHSPPSPATSQTLSDGQHVGDADVLQDSIQERAKSDTVTNTSTDSDLNQEARQPQEKRVEDSSASSVSPTAHQVWLSPEPAHQSTAEGSDRPDALQDAPAGPDGTECTSNHQDRDRQVEMRSEDSERNDQQDNEVRKDPKEAPDTHNQVEEDPAREVDEIISESEAPLQVKKRRRTTQIIMSDDEGQPPTKQAIPKKGKQIKGTRKRKVAEDGDEAVEEPPKKRAKEDNDGEVVETKWEKINNWFNQAIHASGPSAIPVPSSAWGIRTLLYKSAWLLPELVTTSREIALLALVSGEGNLICRYHTKCEKSNENRGCVDGDYDTLFGRPWQPLPSPEKTALINQRRKEAKDKVPEPLVHPADKEWSCALWKRVDGRDPDAADCGCLVRDLLLDMWYWKKAVLTSPTSNLIDGWRNDFLDPRQQALVCAQYRESSLLDIDDLYPLASENGVWVKRDEFHIRRVQAQRALELVTKGESAQAAKEQREEEQGDAEISAAARLPKPVGVEGLDAAKEVIEQAD
ncbi:hypothetical protein VNI00_017585 [Paramarasmius palmivorus]|uniref:Uncharacterized protein n=1 Tax=Paramarasmius palmivorus TaxID=297713 RepID=A0AAW0B612_9AGAR